MGHFVVVGVEFADLLNMEEGASQVFDMELMFDGRSMSWSRHSDRDDVGKEHKEDHG